MEDAMSKQSKQERARKYADGARETVRLADLAADEVKLDLKAIRSSVEAVHDRLDNLAGWNKAAVAEAEEIKDAAEEKVKEAQSEFKDAKDEALRKRAREGYYEVAK